MPPRKVKFKVKAMSGGLEKAFGLLKTLPRVGLNNLRPLRRKLKKKSNRGQHGGKHCGRGQSGQGSRHKLPRLGFEGGNTPFYLQIPKEPYYSGHHVRKQYREVSLKQLQHLIDLGWIDPNEPIDMTTLSNCPIKKPDFRNKEYGYNLTDEGADIFDAKVNIEVQWASELTFASVEKNGGVITNKYYSLECVDAMSNTTSFFRKSKPIPRNKLPPQDAIEYYTDAKSRGYLADPEAIGEKRFELAQKYGYVLPDITKDPLFSMLTKKKDPRQIWFGLEPGWVVNLKDRTVLKPIGKLWQEYYSA